MTGSGRDPRQDSAHRGSLKPTEARTNGDNGDLIWPGARCARSDFRPTAHRWQRIPRPLHRGMNAVGGFGAHAAGGVQHARHGRGGNLSNPGNIDNRHCFSRRRSVARFGLVMWPARHRRTTLSSGQTQATIRPSSTHFNPRSILRRLRRRTEPAATRPMLIRLPGSGTSDPIAGEGAESICPKLAARRLKSTVSTLPS